MYFYCFLRWVKEEFLCLLILIVLIVCICVVNVLVLCEKVLSLLSAVRASSRIVMIESVSLNRGWI